MVNDVLVVGFLGQQTAHVDGQSLKTRNVYRLLDAEGERIGRVGYFDTQCVKKNKLLVFKMLWMILRCKKLVYLPAQNNLKYMFPIIYLLCALRRIDILYFVVGGWLAECLDGKRLHTFLLKRIRGIFAESKQLQQSLVRQYGFANVQVFPNFRIHSFSPSPEPAGDVLKIVFMARINRLKGIDAVFRFAEKVAADYGSEPPVSIDFYGLIEARDAAFFDEQLKRYPFASYRGVAAPGDVHQVLSRYDVSVLPTRYPGEGFPGTILDSYIAGVPVVVSKWKYLPEFVDVGETGYVYDVECEEEFFSCLDALRKDRQLLSEMKKKALEKSKAYSSERAWNIIANYFIDASQTGHALR